MESRLKISQTIYELRAIYIKQCFIEFVGPQNAGKFTLLNKLLKKDTAVWEKTHTDESTRHNLTENIFSVNFPG